MVSTPAINNGTYSIVITVQGTSQHSRFDGENVSMLIRGASRSLAFSSRNTPMGIPGVPELYALVVEPTAHPLTADPLQDR